MTFDTRGEMNKHSRSHIPESHRKFKCSRCGKAFNDSRDLRRHANKKVRCARQVEVGEDEDEDLHIIDATAVNQSTGNPQPDLKRAEERLHHQQRLEPSTKTMREGVKRENLDSIISEQNSRDHPAALGSFTDTAPEERFDEFFETFGGLGYIHVSNLSTTWMPVPLEAD